MRRVVVDVSFTIGHTLSWSISIFQSTDSYLFKKSSVV
ncbi:hypothetical protein IWQ47_004460 [Aquimarina sp. EL_43]|nr:hypothetical protein [Aquimarina sp. EL_35]MBG6153213.1 hypothetical protein [Aquimarina sp. EL_32]MBG6171369.1 hypothetical protein [Aquimarina sp. EL_43]